MVLGLGIDIVEIGRMEQMISKYDMQFLQKVFTAEEIVWGKTKAFPPLHFAGRWAVKEAFYKALPSVCQSLSGWKSIQVLPG